MVEEVVDYLDFESVFALRLSCRGLARRINNNGIFHNAPPGFRNRRRIWKILETIETYESEAITKWNHTY